MFNLDDVLQKLGWWSVPLAGVIGAFTPLLTPYGRKKFAAGRVPIAIVIMFGIVGAGAAVLLLVQTKIQSRFLRVTFTILFGFALALTAAIAAALSLT